MRKTVIFLSLMILFSFDGFTQTKNVNVDNLSYSYSYRSLPTNPLEPIYFTYAAKVNMEGTLRGSISAEELADRISLAGQVKVDNPSDADVVLELTIGDIIIGDREIKERKVEKKDKKTGVVNTTRYYKVVLNYSFDASYNIEKDYEILHSEVLYSSEQLENSLGGLGNSLKSIGKLLDTATGSSMSYESKEYKSHNEAVAFWNENKEALIAKFHKDLALKSAASLSDAASKRYGFPAYNNNEVIKTIKEKKHNENEAFRTAASTLGQALSSIDYNTPLDKSTVTDLIEYFESIPERYTDPTHKADVQLRYAALYNLAKTYSHLEDFDKASEYAGLLIDNGHDAKDGSKLIKSAEEIQAAFNRTGINTRHFSPEVYFSSMNIGKISEVKTSGVNVESSNNVSSAASEEGPSILLDKTSYAPGEKMVVVATAISPEMINAAAFVAVYVAKAAHADYKAYQYPASNTAILNFKAPSESGHYEMRLYNRDHVYTDETFVTRIPFSVTD